jgi:hypothetical protein
MSGQELARQGQSLEQRLGEIDLSDAVACAVLLDDVRQLEAQLGNAKMRLTAAIIEQAKIDGVTSYDLPKRLKAEVRSGSRKSIAGDVLEAKLREAGMSDKRIAEIVTEVVSYKVDAREAKKAAGVNEAYAKALNEASTWHEAQPSVTIRRR